MAPIWFQWTMSDVIGHRETEKALMLGHMYSTDEALSVGMIDKIVAQDELMNSAKTELERWLKIPGKKITLRIAFQSLLKVFLCCRNGAIFDEAAAATRSSWKVVEDEGSGHRELCELREYSSCPERSWSLHGKLEEESTGLNNTELKVFFCQVFLSLNR